MKIEMEPSEMAAAVVECVADKVLLRLDGYDDDEGERQFGGVNVHQLVRQRVDELLDATVKEQTEKLVREVLESEIRARVAAALEPKADGYNRVDGLAKQVHDALHNKRYWPGAHSRDQSLLDHLLDQQVTAQAESEAKKAVREVAQEIRGAVREKISGAISAAILKGGA